MHTRIFTAEDRAKAREGRMKAIPKSTYSDAIQVHCEQCLGVSPAVRDCGGSMLIDGNACPLFGVSTREKRRQTTKTALRRAVQAACRHCTGGRDVLCASPTCALFRHGAGRTNLTAG